MFQYAGNQVLLEKQGSATTATATYTYGNALIRKDGEVPLFDGLGSERTVTDSNQSVTGTLTFEGFGQTVATTGSSTNPYMFAATSGYRTDGDAGLMHVGARYYDAQVGRFVTRDTVLTEHPYIYCNGNPVNALDVDGHIPKWLKGALVGIAVGGLVVVGAAIIAPAAGATVIGSLVIGGLAGDLGGIAAVGYGSDPGDVTWPAIGIGFGGGALAGGCLGPFTGMAPMPWLTWFLKLLK